MIQRSLQSAIGFFHGFSLAEVEEEKRLRANLLRAKEEPKGETKRRNESGIY
jgi:hypothetical protein